MKCDIKKKLGRKEGVTSNFTATKNCARFKLSFFRKQKQKQSPPRFIASLANGIWYIEGLMIKTDDVMVVRECKSINWVKKKFVI